MFSNRLWVLFGKCSTARRALEGDECQDLDVTVRQLKKSEISKACKIEQASHLNDPSSMMHDSFKKKDFLKEARKLYLSLTKSRHCLSVWNGPELAGVIGFFMSKKREVGFVATIAVHPGYQGQGIGKLLCSALCKKFEMLKCPNFLGDSSTLIVLKLAKKLGRRESARTYLRRIRSFLAEILSRDSKVGIQRRWKTGRCWKDSSLEPT